MSRLILYFFCLLSNVLLYANVTCGVHEISIYRETLEYVMTDLKTPKIFVSPYFEYIDSWYIPLDSLNDMPDKKQIIGKIMNCNKKSIRQETDELPQNQFVRDFIQAYFYNTCWRN